jgi:hypothetical protein
LILEMQEFSLACFVSRSHWKTNFNHRQPWRSKNFHVLQFCQQFYKKLSFLPTSHLDSELRDHFCTHNRSSHFQNLSHHFLIIFNLSCKQLSFLTAVLTFATCTSVFNITRQWCHWLFSTFFYERPLVPFKRIRSWEGTFSIWLTWYIKGLGGNVCQFQKRLEYLLITNFSKHGHSKMEHVLACEWGKVHQ